jgi:hypothetical protein
MHAHNGIAINLSMQTAISRNHIGFLLTFVNLSALSDVIILQTMELLCV